MGDSTDNNWLSSWISAAKIKSSEVLEFVKKDLEEFGTAVKNEASSVVSSTGSVLENTLRLNEPESTASSMKRSFSSFLGQMNNVLLKQGPDDSDTEAILITEGCDNVPLTKLQKIVYELQKNEKTFLEDPDSSLQQQYQCWLDIIDEEFTEDRLSKHLLNSPTLHNQYLKLVPDNVSHQLFWKRYLFKKALLEDELAREEAVEKKHLKEKQSTEEFKWDHEDFATDIELSEEEQIRLLQEYEEETKQKTKSKTLDENTNLSSKIIPVNKSEKPIDDVLQADKDTVANEEPVVKENKNEKVSDHKIDKAAFSTSLDLETKSSNSSSDGDWEKINDVDK